MVREAIDAFKNIKQDMMGMTSLIGSSTSLNRRMNGQSKAALADKTDDDQISIYDNNNNINSTTLVNELIKKSVDKVGAVESLGVMIRPNVVVEIDNQIISEPNSSEFDNDPESKGDKRKKKKKASKNAKIMPLNDDWIFNYRLFYSLKTDAQLFIYEVFYIFENVILVNLQYHK